MNLTNSPLPTRWIYSAKSAIDLLVMVSFDRTMITVVIWNVLLTTYFKAQPVHSGKLKFIVQFRFPLCIERTGDYQEQNQRWPQVIHNWGTLMNWPPNQCNVGDWTKPATSPVLDSQEPATAVFCLVCVVNYLPISFWLHVKYTVSYLCRVRRLCCVSPLLNILYTF